MMDHSLAGFLADRDAPCPGCGYNLRGLTTSTCPECRAEIRLGIAQSPPGMPRAALVAASLLLSAVYFGMAGCFQFWFLLSSGSWMGSGFVSGSRYVFYFLQATLYLAFAAASVIVVMGVLRPARSSTLHRARTTRAMFVGVVILGAFSLVSMAFTLVWWLL